MSRTDTERLDWVLAKRPEFEEGYLRLWFGMCAAEDAGLEDGTGYYIAEGANAREQIDNAMDGKLTYIS